MWSRECTEAAQDCKGLGKVLVASFAAASGVAALVMLSLWVTAGARARVPCYCVCHALFVLLVTAAALTFEARGSTMIWLWLAAVPALLLIVYNWHELWPFGLCDVPDEQHPNAVLANTDTVDLVVSSNCCCESPQQSEAGASLDARLERTGELHQRW